MCRQKHIPCSRPTERGRNKERLFVDRGMRNEGEELDTTHFSLKLINLWPYNLWGEKKRNACLPLPCSPPSLHPSSTLPPTPLGPLHSFLLPSYLQGLSKALSLLLWLKDFGQRPMVFSDARFALASGEQNYWQHQDKLEKY